MIILTKINGKEVLINEELIETAYETPDTVILMNNGHTYVVSETLNEILEKTIEFRRNAKRRLPVRRSEKPEKEIKNSI